MEFRRSKTQNDYNKTLAAAIEKHALPKVPAMEVTCMMSTLKEVEIDPEQLKGLSKSQRKKMIARKKEEQPKANHVEHISNSIGSEAYWAMVHQEISTPEAMKIKENGDAMQKEWDKLESPEGRPAAWDVTLVESKSRCYATWKGQANSLSFRIDQRIVPHQELRKRIRRTGIQGLYCFPR